MFREVGYALYKRAIEDGGETPPPHNGDDAPWWVYLIPLFNILVLLPVVIIVHYAFKCIYPVLAIVEDESPPAYEPVPLDEDVPPVPGAPKPMNPPAADLPAAPVTSSMRRIHRTLKANGGWRSYARGLACFLAQVVLVLFGLIIAGNIISFLGLPEFMSPLISPLASFGISMAVVQLSTAWVHIVISKPSPLHFWRRLPECRRTARATWRAVALNTAASGFAYFVPYYTAAALNVKMGPYDPSEPWILPTPKGAGWKIAIVTLLSFAVVVFVTIPAYVVLIRVQASLLPEEDETIVPFDRSFRGKVEPAVVGGKGYVSVRDAWATFSNAAWRRLLVLYVKVSLVVIAFTVVLLLVVLVPEFVILAKAQGH